MSRELQIVEELRVAQQMSPWIAEKLDELDGLLRTYVLWPPQTRAAAEEVLGGSIHNPNGRYHGQLDRRIRHCLKVWRDRYGLNDKQHDYADELIAWSIRQGKAADSPLPYVCTVLDRLVNDERVHAGMERRAGYVDVVDSLKEALA